MAILVVPGLSEGPYTESGIGVRVYERDDGSGARDIRLVCLVDGRSMASDTQKSFYICVKYSGRRKGKTPTTIWRRWYETVDASKCHETQPLSRWTHLVELTTLQSVCKRKAGCFSTWRGGKVGATTPGSSMGSRMEVEIYANWAGTGTPTFLATA